MSAIAKVWTARVLLAIGVLIGVAWLASLDTGKKISTNILDLVPEEERSPEIALVRSIAGNRQARVVLFSLTTSANRERAELAADAFIAELARSPAFSVVIRADDAKPKEALGAHLHKKRFDLLLPGWLSESEAAYRREKPAAAWPVWLAERTATRLEAFLQRPEAVAFQGLLPSDPILLMPGLMDSAQLLSAVAENATAAPNGPVLIWAMTAHSPLDERGQAPVFAAVEKALSEAKQIEADTRIQWAAVNRFAAESRRQIEAEMSGLNLLSLAAVLGVAALSIRRFLKTLHLAPIMLCSLLGAWVATTLFFEKTHVLVFVLGSLLGGVAVDYGFYLFLQPPLFSGETAEEKIRRLLRPLLASALTTILGFSLLLFSDLPLIRQLGVFVSAGLLTALGAAVLWYRQASELHIATRDFIRARTGNLLSGWPAKLIFTVGALVILLGPWRLQWRDDIRSLEIPNPELTQEAASVRALFGEQPGRTLFLTHGKNIAEAKAALERFHAWHRRERPQGTRLSIGSLLPDEKSWQAQPQILSSLSGFEEALRAALERHGFEASAFDPFFTAWKAQVAATAQPSYEQLAAELNQALVGPLSLAMGMEKETVWFATIATHGVATTPEPPQELSTVSAAQLESLNRLFSRYRISALNLSSIGLGLVGLSVFVIYGWREGPRIFALPACSCLFAFGFFGLLGGTMNLFHLLGAFLGVCLSHNYAIFSAENAVRGEAPPPSIRLSALTTALSFGVLALSKIPVVSALGAMVAIIVASALVIVETGMMTPFKKNQNTTPGS